MISQADLLPVLFVKWVIDTISHDKKDSVVKEKQLEALKRLGHTELKLNEYERTFCSAVLKSFAFIGRPGKVANEIIHPDDIPVNFKGPSTPFSSFQILTALLRRWWLGPHHHRSQRVCDISTEISRSLWFFFLSPWSPKGRPPFRSSRVWKDHACQSSREGVWRYFHQHRCICAHKQMVRRIEQACGWFVQSGEENSTIHHIYR
jgi:hypothetical protein